ncbi:MAG: cytochrome c [Novosphingobium sp.]|nr:cytochrome c [Novosphingobium sp.]
MLKLAMLPLLVLTVAAVPVPTGSDDTAYIRSYMQGPVNDATNRLWAVGNAAMDDEGGIDPARMTDPDWDELVHSADLLEVSASKLADAPTIRAAMPGHERDVQPGAYSMKDVQAYFDADPQAFRIMARKLAEHAAKISAAAKAREGKQAGLLVGELDQLCESCHAKYWYPQG